MEEIPSGVDSSGLKARQVESSDFEKYKFLRKLEVFLNPSSVVDLINSNMLTAHEVQVLNKYYPKYKQDLIAAYIDLISTLEHLPTSTNRQISVLFGVPRINKMTLKQKSENKPAKLPDSTADQGKSDL
jgi:hypothetical protein